MLPAEHLKNFQNKLRRVRRLLARQVALARSGNVPESELEAIYELAFFNIFVAFENELTELFKTNLLMATGTNGRKRSIFLPENRSLAARLLVGTNRYFQLLPIEQMEKTAKIYLKDGEPFVSLTIAQKTAVNKAFAIRNHIAHRSRESQATFKKKVLANVTLVRVSYSPGFYLKSSLSLNASYFDHHVSEIGGVLRQLVEAS